MTPEAILHPAVWISGWDPNHAPRVLDRAAELGYSGVIVPLRQPERIDPERIASEFEARGLRPFASGNQTTRADVSSDDETARHEGIQRLRLMLSLTRDMGADHLGGVLYGPLGKADGPVSVDRHSRTAKVLGELAEQAHGLGVRLSCEVVNRYETAMLNTARQAVSFVQESRSRHLGIHLDTFHMNIEEEDPHRAIREALPHLTYLELGQNHRGQLRTGTINFSALLDTAFAAGYTGRIGVEAFSSSILEPDIATGLAIWRDIYDSANSIADDAIEIIRAAWTHRITPATNTDGT